MQTIPFYSYSTGERNSHNFSIQLVSKTIEIDFSVGFLYKFQADLQHVNGDFVQINTMKTTFIAFPIEKT